MIKEKFDLSGSCGIVTGASRGIGRAMAEGLAEMGADLVISARDTGALGRVAEDLSRFGGKVISIPADMTQDGDIEQLVDKSLELLGDIRFVFCNAGIIRRGVSYEHDTQDFDDVLRVNVHAPFLLAKLCASVMIEREHGGSIVFTDSVVSRHGSRNVPGYAASKGAVNMLTRSMANDLGPYGIRVNGIGPGFCETDMTHGIQTDEVRYNALKDRMALGRWGRPEDFAGIAVYLASEASSYVTGTTVYVDGGFLGM